MGVACGDLDGDGRPDLGVTNFYNESMTFYHNLGGGIFVDHTEEIGLAVPTRYRLGFGTAFLDVDNDGHLDIAIANGHVDDFRPEIPYAMAAQLLVGCEGGKLTDVSDRAGPPWQVLRVARGLAAGDLDNDGRIDLLLLAQDGPLAYFHNRTAGGHALTLRLEGKTSNRDAVGARLTVVAGGRRQVAWRFGGGSYQSASDPRLHIGLGDADADRDAGGGLALRKGGSIRPAGGRCRLPYPRGVSAFAAGRVPAPFRAALMVEAGVGAGSIGRPPAGKAARLPLHL